MSEPSRAVARSGAAEKSPTAKPLNRACTCAAVGESCARCGSVVQRRSLDGSQEPVTDIPESVRRTVSRPGRMLDSGVRERMEQHFGMSLGHVRVHTDPDAARSAGDVRAAAYAFGDNLVFNQGYYRPDSRFGRHLLAHELTHVIQQAHGAGSGQALGPAHEQEADRAALALDNPRAPFGVHQASAVGIGPLTFGELQKKAWGYVPDVAKPYVAPLALEVKEQADKIVSPDAEVPPAVVTVIEDPVAAAKQATVKLAAEAKVKARDYSMQQAGRLKGVVMEGTSIVDTLVWTAHMSAQAHGLVDAKSKAPEISGTVAKAIDDVAQAGEKRVFGNLPPEQALVFNSYEIGELEGAIGSQVALSFVGVEEVQLALKALGVLGSVRGLMQMLEKHGVSGWYKNPEFIGALVGVGLSFLSLKSTKASHKITRIVVNTALASGSLISAGPAVWKLYNDWTQIPESDPKRNDILKADLGALVKLVANIVVDILRHQSNKKGGANETTPAHPEAEPPPSGTKTALAEPAVAPPTEVVKPGAAPLHETPVAAAPKVLGTSPAPVETTAPTVKPEAPVDVGLSNRGVRPEPGTRTMGKAEWKAQESAARRAKRIDEAIARVEADAKRSAAEAVDTVAKPAAPDEAPRVTRQQTPVEPTETTKPPVKPAEEPVPSKEAAATKKPAADAESTVTSVKKSDAEAVKPTVNDHEVVVTPDGVGVCSPPPCLVIGVAYAKELAENPELKNAYKRVEAAREKNPDRAAELGAQLVRNLETVRANAARAVTPPDFATPVQRERLAQAIEAAQNLAGDRRLNAGELNAHLQSAKTAPELESMIKQIEASVERELAMKRPLGTVETGNQGVEGTDAIGTTTKPRTRALSHERVLGAGMEAEGGAVPLDHDRHHVALKSGGGEVGERIRELLRISGVSVDDPANGIPLAGQSRDPRAVHGSDLAHARAHTSKLPESNLRLLLNDLETVRGDPAGTQAVLRKHGQRLYENRERTSQEFRLGPDFEPED